MIILAFSWVFVVALTTFGATNTSIMLGTGLASLGLIWGLVIVVASLLLYLTPQANHTLGGIVAVVAIPSFITDFGGLFIGAVLAIAGAVSAYRWALPPEPSLLDEFDGLNAELTPT